MRPRRGPSDCREGWNGRPMRWAIAVASALLIATAASVELIRNTPIADLAASGDGPASALSEIPTPITDRLIALWEALSAAARQLRNALHRQGVSRSKVVAEVALWSLLLLIVVSLWTRGRYRLEQWAGMGLLQPRDGPLPRRTRVIRKSVVAAYYLTGCAAGIAIVWWLFIPFVKALR